MEVQLGFRFTSVIKFRSIIAPTEVLSDGRGYINCYLACWKITCQLHFDNTCTSSDSFQEAVSICSEN